MPPGRTPKRFSVVFVLVLALFLSPAAASKDQGLTGSLEAFRVITTEDGRENFLPADKTQPKDIIEYRLTYKNNGKDPVGHIFITDPIPSGMEYIEASASQPVSGRVEFSIDGGGTYQHWPIDVVESAKNGRRIVTRATPQMVTHIRWTLTDTFKPQHEITVSYRTLIKER